MPMSAGRERLSEHEPSPLDWDGRVNDPDLAERMALAESKGRDESVRLRGRAGKVQEQGDATRSALLEAFANNAEGSARLEGEMVRFEEEWLKGAWHRGSSWRPCKEAEDLRLALEDVYERRRKARPDAEKDRAKFLAFSREMHADFGPQMYSLERIILLGKLGQELEAARNGQDMKSIEEAVNRGWLSATRYPENEGYMQRVLLEWRKRHGSPEEKNS